MITIRELVEWAEKDNAMDSPVYVEYIDDKNYMGSSYKELERPEVYLMNNNFDDDKRGMHHDKVVLFN